MATNWYFNPHTAVFGYGSLQALAEVIKEKEYKKALVVTDEGVVKAGLAAKLETVLNTAGLAFSVFSGVEPNPTTDNVQNGLEQYKEQGCDVIISLGGGSPQDCAKAISLLAYNGGQLMDYLQGRCKAKGAVDLMAVTTTAGTGSECTRAYVITDVASQTKYGIRDNAAQPIVSVNDWELMMGLPRGMTAATGMDALTHAVECLLGNACFLMVERLALSACQLIEDYLPVACNHPENEAGREAMATAQYMAGLAFGNSGVGLVHSMSHQLSAVYGIGHGLANATLLPFVLDFYRPNPHCEKQLAKLGAALDPAGSHGKDAAWQADRAIQLVRELSASVGTNPTLASLGVEAEKLDLLAAKTLEDSSLGNSPVMPSKEQVKAIFARALG